MSLAEERAIRGSRNIQETDIMEGKELIIPKEIAKLSLHVNSLGEVVCILNQRLTGNVASEPPKSQTQVNKTDAPELKVTYNVGMANDIIAIRESVNKICLELEDLTRRLEV